MDIDFRYFLKNQVLWNNIKKYIATDISTPERYINSITWIVNNKHWSLLVYKLKKGERLHDFSAVWSIDTIYKILYETGDLEMVKLLVERYDLFYRKSISNDPFKDWDKDKLQQLKYKVLDLMEFLQNNMGMDGISATAYCLLSHLSLSDSDFIDRMLNNGVILNGRGDVVEPTIEIGNFDLLMYLDSKFHGKFYNLTTTGERRKLFKNMDNLYRKWLLKALKCRQFPIVKYLVVNHMDSVSSAIDLPFIMINSSTEEIFEFLISVYKDIHKIPQSYDTMSYIVNKLVESPQIITDFLLTYHYHPRSILHQVEALKKAIPLITNYKETSKWLHHLHNLKKHRHEVSPLLGHHPHKYTFESFEHFTVDEYKAIQKQKHFTKITLQTAIKLLHFEFIEYFLSVRLKGATYLSGTTKQIKGLIIMVCRRKEDKVTKLILDALPPKTNFGFLLEGMAFGSVKYLVNGGFKTLDSFLDKSVKYPDNILLEAAYFGDFTIFKMVYNQISKTDRVAKYHKYQQHALCKTSNNKIMEFLLNEGCGYSQFFISKCVSGGDPHAIDILLKYIPTQVTQYFNTLKVEDIIKNRYGGYQSKNNIFFDSSLTVFQTIERTLEHPISSNLNIITLAAQAFDFHLVEYMINEKSYLPTLHDITAFLENTKNKGTSPSFFRIIKLLISPWIGKSQVQKLSPTHFIVTLMPKILTDPQLAHFLFKHFPNLLKKYIETNNRFTCDPHTLINALNVLYPNREWKSDKKALDKVLKFIFDNIHFSLHSDYLVVLSTLISEYPVEIITWPRKITSAIPLDTENTLFSYYN
ncbi:hypothetical protein DLAC_01295 [Tieghemostelium lacteum]|uniref:Ankyrin repeat-containing protein n=1 Tax=Tieghemostelium lacteum TaxID=361077 RepID=A0A152A8M1_TIELA|nr:hypothetical protein DLAC_01295 [Tieghemostelium lacteum]|eukprot:KYR02455.1 hypothetical protein DLAC_01295 [Tieghemostelium lacteum]